jgi:hypothetical protein
MRSPTSGNPLCNRHYGEFKKKSFKSKIDISIYSLVNHPETGINIQIRERPYPKLNNMQESEKDSYIKHINHIETKILSFIHNLFPRKFQIDFHTYLDLDINNQNPQYEHIFSMKMSSNELSKIAKDAVSSTDDDICFQSIHTKLENNAMIKNGETKKELNRYLFMSFVVVYELARMPDIADIVKLQRSLNKGVQNVKERMWNPTRNSSLLKGLIKKNAEYFRKSPSRYEEHMERIQKEAKARIDKETLEQHFPIM